MFTFRIWLIVILTTICTIVFAQSDDNKPKFIKVDHSTQEWYKEIQKPRPNYQLVESLYNKYFEDHPLEKSQQKNQVRRWLMTAASQQDAKGNVSPIIVTDEDIELMNRADKNALREYQQNQNLSNYSRNNNAPNATWNDSVGTWRMIGPYHISDRVGVYNMYGGFCDRTFINRLNTQNMISGQSYGGLWTSQDGGLTWKLTDAQFSNGTNEYANRDMYYGDIEVHPAQATRILAATHAGLLISNNSGETWTMADSMNQIKKPGERTYFVAQKPDDVNVILASYGKRIFRSTNGGSTWSLVFNNNGVTHSFNNGQHTDETVYARWYNFLGLEFHPTDPNIVYLGALNSTNKICIYKSTDAGVSFSLLVNTNQSKWSKMMITPADPDHVYLATLFTSVDTPASTDGIYKYNSSGALVSFKPIQGITVSGLVDDVVVSMTDANVWYMGGYASSAVFKSVDGGTTWTFYNTAGYHTGFVDYVHPDVRSISAVGDKVLVGTDGGLHISNDGSLNFNSSGKWISAIDLWGFSSAYKGDVVASGDDHGPSEIRYADKDRGWVPIGGADSGEIQVNACNTNYAYGRDAYSRFVAEKSNDTTYVRKANVTIDAQYKYLSQDADSYFAFYPSKNNILMCSKDNMKTSTNLYSFTNNITKVEVALKDNKTLYVLENRNKVHKSVDGGTTFILITPSTTVTSGRTLITDIEIDETGDNVWLAYGENQTICKVVHSGNGGNTWTNITNGNLPSLPLEHITYQRGTNGMVYVAMKRQGGIWYKSLSQPNWLKLGSGLPWVSYVTSIYTVPDCNKFRMGTSRGAFEHNLAIPSNVGAHFSVNTRETKACYLDTTYFYDYSSYSGPGVTFKWTFEGGSPAISTVMNPKVVYNNPGIFDVTLVVTDGNGNSSTYYRDGFMAVTSETGCGPQTLPSKAQFTNNQNQYVQTPSMGLVNTRNYTMMAWVKGDGTQVDYAGIFSHSLSNGTIVLNARSAGTDSTQLGYHHPNGAWWWDSGHYLKPNQWTHLAIVVEPTGISIYKNGIQSKHSITVAAANLTQFCKIGSFIGAETYRNFKGYIDEFAFYNRSLTTAEIRSMMHLTKQNPKYIDQQDPTLIAYYQYNDNLATQVTDLTGNGKNGTSVGAVQFLESDVPAGGGRSQTLNVTTAGNYDFTDPGVTIQFSSPTPNGNIVVSHLENAPDVVPSTKKMHENGYYIINNFGLTKTFGPLVNMEFSKTGTVSTEVASSGIGFEIWKRPSNMHDQAFTSVINSNITSSAGNYGKVTATNANAITSFSQFILTRNPYPQDFAKVSMTTPTKSTTTIEGGESVSLYIASENQGFKLPKLNAATLSAAGTPQEGMMAYNTDIKKIIVFSNATWNTIKAGPIFKIVNGTTIPTKGIVLGQPNITHPSAILDIEEPGFVKYKNTNDEGLKDIKYPTESLILYNSSSKSLQYFNGSNWVNFNLEASLIPISTATPLVLNGFTVGNSTQLPNAVVQDEDLSGAVLIPSLRAEDIKDPAEGLLIFDNVRKYFFYFDGLYWNRVEK
jgi:hypothetical protein